jgi:hypothetical protein
MRIILLNAGVSLPAAGSALNVSQEDSPLTRHQSSPTAPQVAPGSATYCFIYLWQDYVQRSDHFSGIIPPPGRPKKRHFLSSE